MGYEAQLHAGGTVRVSKYTREGGNILYVDQAGNLYDEHYSGFGIVPLGRQAVGGSAAYDSVGDTEAAAVAAPSVGSLRLPMYSGWGPRSGFTGTAGTGSDGELSCFDGVMGHYVEWPVWLEAGDYSLDFNGVGDVNRGIASIKLDGVELATVDGYRASTTKYFVYDAATFTVTVAGVKTIRVEVSGDKNASSSDIVVNCSKLVLRGPGIGVVVTGPPGGAGDSSWNHYSGGFPLSGEADAHYSSTVDSFDETRVWIPAGTYDFDCEALIGTSHGVSRLKLDGVAVGTPQAAGTLRPGGAGAAPGNGNKGGAALATGEVDHYDSAGGGAPGAIPQALTGIVVATTGWHTVRREVAGQNSAATGAACWNTGHLRRTA